MRNVLAAAATAVLVVLVSAGSVGPASAQGVCDGIAPVDPSDLVKVDLVTGLPGRPLFLASPPGDRDRRFVVDQDGRILLHRRGDAPGTFSTVLDLTGVVGGLGNETGLLGLAFDPDFDPDAAGDDWFWVNYTVAVGFLGVRTVIARYRMDPSDPDLADATSEVRILTLDQPQSNHNAGWLAFGPDGYLYAALGDGGGSGDAHGTCGNGQDESNLFGAILRLDVRGAAPAPVAPECGGVGAGYQVPGDNPYVGIAGCDEIWVSGLRNPWRNAIDRANGDLYVADVGQGCWEEVNWVAAGQAAGANFGWRQMEGNHCYQNGGTCEPANQPCAGSPACFDPSLVLPVAEYRNYNNGLGGGVGCSITGGYPYRGCRMPSLSGTYFYGDYCSGLVRSFRIAGGAATDPRDWSDRLGVAAANSLTSFGEDAEGELFIVERTGRVSKIVPPLADIEVSGAGADFFRLARVEPWTWEDVRYTSEHPVTAYKVYRGQPGGTFSCIQQTATPSWVGDPEDPAPGALFAYVVTALDASSAETSSGSPPRDLSAAACQ